MSALSDILSYIRSSKVIIIDGYECTGKTYLVDQLALWLPLSISYKVDYDKFNDNILHRGNRHIPGLVAMDIFCNNEVGKEHLILDRCFLSSLVYREFYEQQTDVSSPEELLKSVIKIIGDSRVSIIYKMHTNNDKARRLFIDSSLDHEHNDKYDPSNFNVYMDYYHKFNDLFLKWMNNPMLKKDNISMIKVDSLNNNILEVN